MVNKLKPKNLPLRNWPPNCVTSVVRILFLADAMLPNNEGSENKKHKNRMLRWRRKGHKSKYGYQGDYHFGTNTIKTEINKICKNFTVIKYCQVLLNNVNLASSKINAYTSFLNNEPILLSILRIRLNASAAWMSFSRLLSGFVAASSLKALMGAPGLRIGIYSNKSKQKCEQLSTSQSNLS